MNPANSSALLESFLINFSSDSRFQSVMEKGENGFHIFSSATLIYQALDDHKYHQASCLQR